MQQKKQKIKNRCCLYLSQIGLVAKTAVPLMYHNASLAKTSFGDL
jgi:hypothetical protein